MMRHPKEGDFAERRQAAAAAKKQLLEKLNVNALANDPNLRAKLAEKAALAEARDARRREREQLKQQEAERQRIEAAARAEAEAAAAAAAAAAKAELEESERAARKAERDRRYAARKNRKR